MSLKTEMCCICSKGIEEQLKINLRQDNGKRTERFSMKKYFGLNIRTF
jgi:hypothetical protein